MTNTILVNLSNRHIHLNDEDVATLFGHGHTLTVKADLLQPGQFAAEEVVTICCGDKSIERVRVVGPTRPVTQCEILTGDLYRLGLTSDDVPVRLSGDIEGSTGFEIIGPAGSVKKEKGLIIAQRHIHINPKDAEARDLQNKQVVSITSDTPLKRATYHDVVVRVQEGAELECHIDTEEGNAAGIANGDLVEIKV